MDFSFWAGYLEAFRIDALINMFLAVEKVGVLPVNLVSYMGLNFCAGCLVTSANIAVIFYQFLRIKKMRKHRKSKKLAKGLESGEEEGSSMAKIANIRSRDPEHSVYNPFLAEESEIEKSIEEAANALKAEKENYEKPKLAENKNIDGGMEEEDHQHFYKVYNEPLNGLKDLAITMVMVWVYNSAESQTSIITFILAAYLILDYIYRPEDTLKENIENLASGTIFLMISLSMTAQGFLHGKISRKFEYYVLGFLTIALALGLLLVNFVGIIWAAATQLWTFYKKGKKKPKGSQINKVQPNQTDQQNAKRQPSRKSPKSSNWKAGESRGQTHTISIRQGLPQEEQQRRSSSQQFSRNSQQRKTQQKEQKLRKQNSRKIGQEAEKQNIDKNKNFGERPKNRRRSRRGNWRTHRMGNPLPGAYRGKK